MSKQKAIGAEVIYILEVLGGLAGILNPGGLIVRGDKGPSALPIMGSYPTLANPNSRAGIYAFFELIELDSSV